MSRVQTSIPARAVLTTKKNEKFNTILILNIYYAKSLYIDVLCEITMPHQNQKNQAFLLGRNQEHSGRNLLTLQLICI